MNITREHQFEMRFVLQNGEVGAGSSVLPFTPRARLVPVAVPVGSPKDEDMGTLVVRGCSLEDLGIIDGDILIFRKTFTKRQCIGAICIVLILATGELVAKKVLFGNDGMITLRASGGGIRDMQFSGEEIEIKGVAFAVQRMI